MVALIMLHVSYTFGGFNIIFNIHAFFFFHKRPPLKFKINYCEVHADKKGSGFLSPQSVGLMIVTVSRATAVLA